MNTIELILLIAAYLVGAIPFGLLVGQWIGVGDIRTQGSGNIGATNVLRVAGRRAGAIALALDMGKGAVVTGGAMAWLGADSPWTAGCVVAVFLGHLYPVYLKFKGGKGVAVALGALLAWTPVAGLIMIITWLGMAKLVKISSLSALTAFLIGPLSLLWLPAPKLALATHSAIALLVFWRHRANIQRLIQGKEPVIGR
ncbi:MAG: glycerol-3-phosphate 1-O-acyltransferase PlsY [Magnetococcales bacterium]|nr:glycerol-3-phosphate 1-O-acyltransferase PlsY [Magnetococcales bacterium]